MQPYVDSKELDIKEQDRSNWMLGKYIEASVATAVEHNLAGKKAKSKYYDKPFLEQAEEQQKNQLLTDEDKKLQTEKFFDMLKIMQTNFNLNKRNVNE